MDDDIINAREAEPQAPAVGGRQTRQLPDLPEGSARPVRRQPPAKRPGLIALALLATMMLGMFFGGAGAGAVMVATGSSTAAATAAVSSGAAISRATSNSANPVADVQVDTLGAAYAEVAPSVVLVKASVTSNTRGRTVTGEATGSGIVVDTTGHILTNYHVIEGATSVSVELPGGSSYTASVLGTSPANDLAVLKIAATGLTPAALGDSSTVQVGDSVIAIGYPYDLGETLTAGIVSGLDRSTEADSQQIFAQQTSATLSGLIQVDAAINPGNSGGALVNTDGQVIGITTLIESPVEGFTGIGLAIPINQALSLINQLEQGA